ncbi:MAG: hypothetical protein DI616_13310 [Paracoccus denitrificans]|uniref:Lipoprotein n=1 Tax=Paracoccus denitrificans TaxID=266 RepID=A0A533I2G9_PARDE|nr:MAG: hypothetical protein DI616_13310 [Paracoccus denitrificans]
MSSIRILAAGLAAAALAGCAIPNERAVPDEVTFVGSRLSVYFSNGMQCHSDGVVGSASGSFDRCPIPARYDVTIHSGTLLPAGLAEPFADIVVTMPDGRWKLFKTPESRNWTARSADAGGL